MRFMLVSAACVSALAVAPIAVAFFQLPDEPSPESGTSQVVAQGVLDLGEGDLRWQVVARTAPPPANAAPEVADPGFLAVDSGVVLVENQETGEQHRLPAGEAMFSPAGAEQLRIALGSEAASYLDYDLIPADREAPAEGSVLFSSEPFAGPGARHDVDLIQDALAPGSQMAIPAGTVATLVVINSGTADVTTENGDIVSLAAGEGAALPGALVITAGENGANASAVYTGPSVPRLTQEGAPRAAATPAAGRAVEVATAAPQEPDASPVATVEPEQAVAAEETDDDGDGLTTTQERDAGTDAALADTDEDGLTDGQEVLEFGTNPLSADSDGDGVLDGDEVAQGADPLDGLAVAPEAGAEAQAPVDEVAPAVEAPAAVEEPAVAEEPAPEAAPPAGDGDGDGLEDSIEAELGTDPFDTDTDDDGLSDGDEYYVYQTGTRNPDTDADGVLDGTEAVNGTNPNDPTG